MTITPTAEQQKILDLGPTSIRVRAGAGTGKTTTIALVIANLIEKHGIAPESILGLTFTNKAAAELALRVRELLPTDIDGGRQVEVHTYHGFAAQLLSEFGPIAGVDNSKGVITPTFARQLIRDVVLHRRHRHLDITNMRVTDQVRRLSDQLGDHLLTPADLIRGAEIHAGDEIWERRLDIAETLNEYNRAKAELRVVDYSDLVTRSTTLLRDNPELSDTVRDRYRVLVLDEYQDTNPAQRVLLTTIFDHGFPVIGVGDEDQTIYEWRGASAQNFELFLDHFRGPDGAPSQDESLTLNRRSGQPILDIANQVRQKANPGSDFLESATNGPTEIVTHWAGDALAEAEWIARQFESLHESGVPWSDMAVLFRKNKDFAVVVDVLAKHEIPVEVANVGGLLSVPEIGLLRSWLSVLHNPEDSTAVAQILFGSSYRLGIADLATLTGWLARTERDDTDSEESHAISLIEALESETAVANLRPEAQGRVRRFASTYRTLLVETQGCNLAETCRLILDHINAWQDIEALPASARLSARLNTYRFLDLADDWSPLAGRPSLGAFLDYLDMMEDEPAEELDSARLSGEEAVTLVTVHRAKGLEWANVAIPAVAKGNFPASSGAFPDPVRFADQLPIEFRLDTVLDDFPDDRKARDALLRARHKAQEWRVAYVALTRAKQRLLVSGAYWYGLPEPRLTPSDPSELFALVESHPASRSDGHAAVGPRPAILRTSDGAVAPDPLFEDGWQGSLRDAAGDPSAIESLAVAHGGAAEFKKLVAEWEETLFKLDVSHPVAPPTESRSVSVTGLVTYAQCPKRYFWSEVDTLPRRANPAAVRGNQIHRRIELHQRGQVPFEELTPDLYDTVDGSEASGPGAYGVYEDSRFANKRAELVEAPFTLEVGPGSKVRGRVDAIYIEDGKWEIVDFKSGRHREDPSRVVQLQAYAVAAKENRFGLSPTPEIDVTFAYLGGGKLNEITVNADEKWVTAARDRLVELTSAISEAVFDPNPGEWCGSCDFLRFCGPGQAQVNR